MSTYINDVYSSNGGLDGLPVQWELITWDRLAWAYGPDRADQIQAGRDPKTQADLAAWRNLGRGRDAA